MSDETRAAAANGPMAVVPPDAPAPATDAGPVQRRKAVPPARAIVRRLVRAARSQQHAYWRSQPIRADTVLYESFAGNGMLCNPEAIFRHLLHAPDMQTMQHIWVLSDLDEYSATVREFAGASNVVFVRRGSPAYYRALATSAYLINNATFPPEFSKRPGQTYVNTWHGTPLKLMGFDMPGGALDSANTLRNFVAADYLVSQSPYMTETLYARAYKLRGVFRGEIIEEGHPRVDRQYLTTQEKTDQRLAFDECGLRIDDRKILVYAPTWRGSSFTRPDDNLGEILTALRRLEQSVDSSWRVLLKLHQAAHSHAAHRPELRDVLIPNRVPTNVVLGVTDALVTDYSSIFFDFLPTGRPIVFFSPDQEEYVESRGLYLSPDELPGPVFTTIDDAAAALQSVLDGTWPSEAAPVSSRAQQDYCPWDDGRASERVVDVVFRGRRDGHRIRTIAHDGRTSILLHIGGMRPNGITTSAFNLVNSIDHERYDVSVLYPGGQNARRMLVEKPMHPAVRHFPRIGGMNGSKFRHARRRVLDRLGLKSTDLSDPVEYRLWHDEWVRCFGDSRFDLVVDFSGYGPFWARLLLHSPPAFRSIWLHNDMSADAKRSVHGKFVHARSLNIVFSHYRDYDRLVSVSRSLASINRRKLADRAPAEKFVFAPNCIDVAEIRRLATEDVPQLAAQDAATSDELAWLADTEDVVFVTAGRLSPEKNHARLLGAFSDVHAAHPSTRLVIIGAGPLLATLRRLSEELGLTNAVTFAGYQSNPYAIMARADCFVLSSDYEGQPMVLLEAAVLGLSIVTVAFESVGDALPAGAALVVPQTREGLARGLSSYLAGSVPAAQVDAESYNERAVEAFYRAVQP